MIPSMIIKGVGAIFTRAIRRRGTPGRRYNPAQRPNYPCGKQYKIQDRENWDHWGDDLVQKGLLFAIIFLHEERRLAFTAAAVAVNG